MSTSDGLWLRMTRVLPASRAAVWRAMTNPDELALWWGPQGFTVPSVEFEPKVGASYRIAMQPPEGETFHLEGEVRAVDAHRQLAYTFRWDPPDPEDRETVVTLTFRDDGDRTGVELTQGEFTTEGRLSLHDGGWNDSFEKLEEMLG